jgi:hypothetical protein
MANSAIEIPFYVARDGKPLAGSSAEMSFDNLQTINGADKSANEPVVSEIGGGWYKFSVAYGSAPFDEGDLVGVINADKDGTNNLANSEKYIPVEARLDFYALSRLVNKMGQDKFTGDMLLKNESGDVILKLDINETDSTLERSPEVNS